MFLVSKLKEYLCPTKYPSAATATRRTIRGGRSISMHDLLDTKYHVVMASVVVLSVNSESLGGYMGEW